MGAGRRIKRCGAVTLWREAWGVAFQRVVAHLKSRPTRLKGSRDDFWSGMGLPSTCEEGVAAGVISAAHTGRVGGVFKDGGSWKAHMSGRCPPLLLQHPGSEMAGANSRAQHACRSWIRQTHVSEWAPAAGFAP